MLCLPACLNSPHANNIIVDALAGCLGLQACQKNTLSRCSMALEPVLFSFQSIVLDLCRHEVMLQALLVWDMPSYSPAADAQNLLKPQVTKLSS